VIEQRVSLIKRSTDRLLELLKVSRDKLWWQILKREADLHLRRSKELVKEVKKLRPRD
jgi:hypothetical protein